MSLRPLTVLGLLIVGPCATVVAANPDPSSAATAPDPATVERYGPAYRYPKAGWIVVHVEGKPYDRGYQHGRLLAPEIVDYITTLATKRSAREPGHAWNDLRTLVNALFLRRYDPEYLDEMKGIADGAAAAGAKFDGRSLDLIDIAAVNSDIELEFLGAALDATATGLEARRFARPEDTSAHPAPPEHCSAFAATGPATADGKIVFGHITMFSLPFVRHFNVWLDIKPSEGHRVMMQTYAGGIMSGMDYYLNDAGLIVAETTIAQTKFDINGQALASRIRKALQYSSSIDQVVDTVKASNNGLYTNEWLIADTKTNEVAMFELGTHKNRLWRSSKDEWFGGTKGFYWGCNNAKDLGVRLETVASLEAKPANVVFHPSDRDRTWLRLFEKYKGKIDEGFGFEAFTTPPLSAFASCDAKFTTSAMAKELKTWALFGPPLGHTWVPTEQDRARCPTVQPLVSNDWTILSVDAPPTDDRTRGIRAANATIDRAIDGDGLIPEEGSQLTRAKEKLERAKATARNSSDPAVRSLDGRLRTLQAGPAQFREQRRVEIARELGEPERSLAPPAVDLASSSKARSTALATTEIPKQLPPAWRGTILPVSDADIWLAAAFADYEPIVALQIALRAKIGTKTLPKGDRERIDLAMFAPHSHYAAAVRRWERDPALSEIRSEKERDEWYAIASGKGVLLLAELRAKLGDDIFLKLMDDFGRSHAGTKVATQEFRQAVVALEGHPVDPTFFDHWLGERGLPVSRFAATWSIDSFLAEPEKALIVCGTLKDRHAQREAAELLQLQIARIWSNIRPPIRSDVDVSDEELKTHHILLIGRPDTNAVAAKYANKVLAVKFRRSSFTVGDETYAHPATGVIAAGDNPLSPRYELVIFAGLSAQSSRSCVQRFEAGPPAEVLILASGATPRRLVYSEGSASAGRSATAPAR